MEWFWCAFIFSSASLLLAWLFSGLLEMIIEANEEDTTGQEEENP